MSEVVPLGEFGGADGDAERCRDHDRRARPVRARAPRRAAGRSGATSRLRNQVLSSARVCPPRLLPPSRRYHGLRAPAKAVQAHGSGDEHKKKKKHGSKDEPPHEEEHADGEEQFHQFGAAHLRVTQRATTEVMDGLRRPSPSSCTGCRRACSRTTSTATCPPARAARRRTRPARGRGRAQPHDALPDGRAAQGAAVVLERPRRARRGGARAPRGARGARARRRALPSRARVDHERAGDAARDALRGDPARPQAGRARRGRQREPRKGRQGAQGRGRQGRARQAAAAERGRLAAEAAAEAAAARAARGRARADVCGGGSYREEVLVTLLPRVVDLENYGAQVLNCLSARGRARARRAARRLAQPALPVEEPRAVPLRHRPAQARRVARRPRAHAPLARRARHELPARPSRTRATPRTRRAATCRP